jgi:hypothetical protein
MYLHEDPALTGVRDSWASVAVAALRDSIAR